MCKFNPPLIHLSNGCELIAEKMANYLFEYQLNDRLHSVKMKLSLNL